MNYGIITWFKELRKLTKEKNFYEKTDNQNNLNKDAKTQIQWGCE